MALLSNPLFWVATIPTTIFIGVIGLLIRHNNAINRLNNQLSKLDGNIRIEQEVGNIESYVRIIAYVAIAFCLGVAIHYLAVELPRILNNDYSNSHLHNLGVDYLGLIVAIFAIIVTLLVTWNIYSTINAKEELRVTKQDVELRFADRIKKLEDCCNQRKTEIIELNTTYNNINQNTDKQIRNLRANILRFMAITWSASLLNLSRTAIFNRMLSSCINSVNEYIQNDEFDKANLTLSYMMEDATKIKNEVHLPQYAKEALIKKFTQVNGYTKLDKADDFIELISNISDNTSL